MKKFIEKIVGKILYGVGFIIGHVLRFIAPKKKQKTGRTDASLVVGCDSRNYGIGFEGTIPWKVKGDLSFFKKITSRTARGQKGVLVCGKNTYDSLDRKNLPKRHMIVVSKSLVQQYIDEVVMKISDPLTTYMDPICKLNNFHAETHVADPEDDSLCGIILVNEDTNDLIAIINDPKYTEAIQNAFEGFTGEPTKLFIIGGSNIYNQYLDGVGTIDITDVYVTKLNLQHDETIGDVYNRYDTFFDIDRVKRNYVLEHIDTDSVSGHEVHHFVLKT